MIAIGGPEAESLFHGAGRDLLPYADAVRMVRRVPLFARLDPAKLKLLAFSSAYLTFEKGDTVFRAGDSADAAYLIEEGVVDVVIENEGHERTIGTLGHHELFGEMAIFLNEPRSATLRAAGRLTVLKIDREVFVRMVTENPNAALGVMRALSVKLKWAIPSTHL